MPTATTFDAPAPAAALRFEPRHALAALVVAALVAVVLGFVSGSSAAGYQSRALLAIDQPKAIAAAGSAGVVDKLSKLRAKYAGLSTTDVMAQPVADAVGVPVATVRGSVRADAVGDSLLLAVTAKVSRASQATQLASAMSDEIVHYVGDEQTRNAIPSEQRFQFSVVVPASAGEAVSNGHRRQIRIALVGFVVAGLLTYLALELLTGERRR